MTGVPRGTQCCEGTCLRTLAELLDEASRLVAIAEAVRGSGAMWLYEAQRGVWYAGQHGVYLRGRSGGSGGRPLAIKRV